MLKKHLYSNLVDLIFFFLLVVGLIVMRLIVNHSPMEYKITFAIYLFGFFFFIQFIKTMKIVLDLMFEPIIIEDVVVKVFKKDASYFLWSKLDYKKIFGLTNKQKRIVLTLINEKRNIQKDHTYTIRYYRYSKLIEEINII